MGKKQNGAAGTSAPRHTPVTVTSTPVEHIPWKEAVAKGKAIKAQQAKAERSNYELGELAHKVIHPTYKDRTLAKYAEAIGEKPQRLDQYRSVWRAWDGAGIFAPGQISFAVLKELMAVTDRGELIAAEPNMTKRRAEVLRVLKDHPQRVEILSEHPNLSCTTQARNTMREYDTGDAKGDGDESEWTKHNVKLFKNLIEFGIDATNAIEGVLDASPEKQRAFFQVVQPLLLMNLRVAGCMVVKFVDDYYELQEAEEPATILQAAE